MGYIRIIPGDQGCRWFQQLCSGDVGWHGEHGSCQLEAGTLPSAGLDHHLRLSHQGNPIAWKGSLSDDVISILFYFTRQVLLITRMSSVTILPRVVCVRNRIL